jgi:uncharacterized membrane protein
MTITHELVIQAPVEQVWALTVDVESWPSMTPTMTSVERLDDGPLRVGSTARIKQPHQRPRVWTVTELRPEELFVWETKALGVRMAGSHRLRPVEGGCRNTLGVQLSGGLAALVQAALNGQLRKTIATENEGFRRAAEGATL